MGALTLLIGLGLTLPATASADLPGGYTSLPISGPSPANGDRFGEGIAVGDVTGDGFMDLAAGVPGARPDVNAPGVTGRVYVINGVTGAIAWEAHQPTPQPETRGDVATGFGTAVAVLGDIGSCTSSGTCQIAGPDGFAEVLASAPGGDVGGTAGADQGIVYVLDGASGRIMKRLVLAADARSPAGPSRFGSSVLVPSGRPPCRENGGLGPCADVPQRVALGDLDNGGKPDIVVGAPQFGESLDTNEFACSANCPGVGKVLIFRGEDISGSSQTDLGSTSDLTLSYFEPAGTTTPNFGSSLRALGDIGSCTADATANAKCYGPNGQTSNTPDGAPDLLISAPGVSRGTGTGATYVVDGARLAALLEKASPADAPLTGLVRSRRSGTSVGVTGPDLVLPTPALNGQGAAWVFEGDVNASGLPLIGRLDDPAPVAGGAFGTVVAPLGNIAGDSQGELAVLRPGSPGRVDIFSACKTASLQSIGDPSPQPDTGFGSAIAPVGDVNLDGYLDVAVGAPRLNGSGAVHIFLSNATAGPAFAGCNPPPPAPMPGPGPADGGCLSAGTQR